MVNGDEKFQNKWDFFKKGFCFLSEQKDLRSTRNFFEFTCVPGSGAHDALKFVLVAHRSWSEGIKKREKFCFSKKNIPPPTTSKILSALCSSDYSEQNALKNLLVVGGEHLEKKRSE